MPNNKNILREKINELNLISNHFQEMTEILKGRDKTDWNTIKNN